MSEFKPAIQYALENECDDRKTSGQRIADVGGGFVNDPDDRGGPTVYGLSEAIRYREDLTPADFLLTDFSNASLKTVTRDTAETVYKRIYWDRYGYAVFSQDVAAKIMDHAININWPKGSSCVTAHMLAQEAAGATPDGVLGPNTIAAINHMDPQVFLSKYVDILVTYYTTISKKPGQSKFLPIWLNRARRTF
jgi:lysozyme family protein